MAGNRLNDWMGIRFSWQFLTIGHFHVQNSLKPWPLHIVLTHLAALCSVSLPERQAIRRSVMSLLWFSVAGSVFEFVSGDLTDGKLEIFICQQQLLCWDQSPGKEAVCFTVFYRTYLKRNPPGHRRYVRLSHVLSATHSCKVLNHHQNQRPTRLSPEPLPPQPITYQHSDDTAVSHSLMTATVSGWRDSVSSHNSSWTTTCSWL